MRDWGTLTVDVQELQQPSDDGWMIVIEVCSENVFSVLLTPIGLVLFN